jgi:hypothetical protein
MTTTTPTTPDEALAAVDSPEAVADRRKRAKKWAEELEGRDRGYMFALAGGEAINSIYAPLKTQNRLYGDDLAKAEREAGRIADQVVLTQCEIALRAADIQAVTADPEREAAQKVWSEYANGVAAIAWAQGDREADFIRRWRDLIAARRDAEEYDDAATVRAIDARLLRLVGIAHPQLPAAAWDAADQLSESERQAEYDRLEAKYGPRSPDTNGASTKTSRRPRLNTRPLELENTR